MRRMFELDDIDWSSMKHAYGSAEEVPALLRALRTQDAGDRDKALSRFYSAVHHQGDVYPCTTACLPFLLELAAGADEPGRDEVVRLLVSIGTSAVERCEGGYPEDVLDYAGAAAVLRDRAEVFVGLASDADLRVRQAAIPGVGLLVDDASRAAAVLRGRLEAESGAGERLLVIEAMGTLALRLPAVLDEAMAWFTGLAPDPAVDPATRLAALVQQVRCAPGQVDAEVVPLAIRLLREVPPVPVADGVTWDAAVAAVTAPPVGGALPQITAAFADLDRQARSHALTTGLLRTFHEALAARVPDRTALLAEQLRSPDLGIRTDAIRMSGELMEFWRGDHASLIVGVAGQLASASYEIAAEAAAILDACHPIAGPARQALAAHVAAQRAMHGPNVWGAPQPQLRRAHQNAVLALARLGDEQAVPSVLAALDSGVDDWRAVQAARFLPMAAGQLVPRLCDHLRRADLAQDRAEMSVSPLLSALAAFRDPAALPVITGTLEAAVHREQWKITSSALAALGAFGPAAAPALTAIRSLASASDAHVRPAAITALWTVSGNQDEVMPLLLGLLEDRIFFRITAAADTLAQLGVPALAALPRLRELLAHDYDWVRAHCAAALWEIGGPAEAPAVLNTLLQAWAHNPHTANHVVACLDRMGRAAAPALPQLRSQLALPRRSGRFASIANDEELQRLSRAIIERLA